MPKIIAELWLYPERREGKAACGLPAWNLFIIYSVKNYDMIEYTSEHAAET
jgi:hypothetical protein